MICGKNLGPFQLANFCVDTRRLYDRLVSDRLTWWNNGMTKSILIPLPSLIIWIPGRVLSNLKKCTFFEVWGKCVVINCKILSNKLFKSSFIIGQSRNFSNLEFLWKCWILRLEHDWVRSVHGSIWLPPPLTTYKSSFK